MTAEHRSVADTIGCLRMIAQRDAEIAKLSMDNRVLQGEVERLRATLEEKYNG